MIKTRHLHDPPIISYRVKYGYRRQLNTNVNGGIVDFSFLKPRAGIKLHELQELTPEWKKNLEYLIRHSSN